MKIFNYSLHRPIARAADAARDAQDWSKAAELYGEFIEKNRNNKKILRYYIQKGNCLKEAGKLKDALETYELAETIDNRNSDLFLQKGHLYKVMGREIDSVRSYQTAFDLDPQNIHAKHELERSNWLITSGILDHSPTSKTKQQHIIWLDVTDFVDYVKVNVSLSGIQRVLLNLVSYIKHFDIPGYKIVPVIPEYGNFRFFAVDTEKFFDLIDIFNAVIIERHMIDTALEAVLSSKKNVSLQDGDIFVVAGAFWIFSHYDLIMHNKNVGVKFGLFIHDLIQVRMPEYVEKAATDAFQIQLSDALDVCDFVLANSEYVAQDVKDYLHVEKNYSLPVEAILLPTELSEKNINASITNRNITDLSSKNYALVVSTIEVRKNHKLLIKIWEQLREEFGENVPYLVFVGKWGWEVEKFRQYIEEQGYIGDWLFVFNGISDAEVEYLYKNCLLSLYPSFAEGFGLPIGESLAYGKPCIASNTTSMPEVGRDFVRYIDPFDVESSYAVVRDTLINRDDLHAWEQRIVNDFKPKTWEQFSREFFTATVKYAELLKDKRATSNSYLPSCTLIAGGSHDILNMARRGEKIITFRSARKSWWYPANHWGAWSQNRRCEIEFISDCCEGEVVDIFLRLHRQSARQSDPIAIADAGTDPHAFRLSEHQQFFKLSGIVRADGVVNIQLLARGKFPGNTPQGGFIGWSGIAYCKQGHEDDTRRTYDALICPGRLPVDLPFESTEPLILE
ncbi:glycosyltransferase [Acetobacter orientalis]|uniref:Glycosyl transferase family 1 domain-containing protein n=1 Tax=Acetobacter orientalis TaxID=146474 RepID=A0A0D6NIP4_9PROT|nr:glycosyltransferase [Acetobacter orientalis]GAN65942.1 hypothetical protein Abor_014_107 [Acetobacter orientalis]GBR20173.1 hypothetical protein AA0481_2054 [Acetobacter orientalis NRIC 0481]GEL60384.1 hypothetical protein AOR02nite_02260 [Acetobacter orientalis]